MSFEVGVKAWDDTQDLLKDEMFNMLKQPITNCSTQYNVDIEKIHEIMCKSLQYSFLARVCLIYMEQCFRNKDIPKGKEAYVYSYLDCLYQDILEKRETSSDQKDEDLLFDTSVVIVRSACVL